MFNCVIGNSSGGEVVAVDGCGRLGVTQFLKNEANDVTLLCIDKEGTKFSFGGGRGDKFENGADSVDGTIEFDGEIITWGPSRKVVFADAASCCWCV